MVHEKQETLTCQICKKNKRINDLVPAALVRTPIAELILKDYPDWSFQGHICLNDLNLYRGKYVQDSLEAEKGELSDLDQEVVNSLSTQDLLSKNINQVFASKSTVGEKLADGVAAFGGSWTFIICFSLIIIVWITLNIIALFKSPFDPYPFILLNLVLSCLAAVQAPIIMMSQNRQDAKDRMRAESDYQVNLKAELEIRHLNAKLDLLLSHQWNRLLEIQRIQIDQMQELIENCRAQIKKK